MDAKIICGDALDELRKMDENSLDSLVTDPPYGWRFMGKSWDIPDIDKMKKAATGKDPRLCADGLVRPPRQQNGSIAAGTYDQTLTGNQTFQEWTRLWACEVYRVLKPGAHVLIFCGPRTYHRMASGVEDAGFEVRDCIQWIFAQGFPKSFNIEKSLKKNGLYCTCMVEYIDESLCDLPQTMASDKSVSGSQKQDLLKPMQESVDQQKSHGQIPHAADGMHSVQAPIQTQMEKENPSQDVLLSMPGHSEILKSEKHGAHEADCGQYERSSEKGQAARPSEFSVEGRRDVQTKQGKLHRPKVRAMPKGFSPNGTQGRLHHGTSSNDGDAHGAMPDSDRGGPSQGSQPSEQSNIQPAMVPKQPGSQTCGRCGKARDLEGWGTALKPANEPILLARKPLSEKTVAANVLKWGTGAINIDGCRVGSEQATTLRNGNSGANGCYGKDERVFERLNPPGRFPSNLILSHSDHCTEESHVREDPTKSVWHCVSACPVRQLDEQSGERPVSGSAKLGKPHSGGHKSGFSTGPQTGKISPSDTGGASRFFYCAKASKSERNRGCEDAYIYTLKHDILDEAVQEIMSYVKKES